MLDLTEHVMLRRITIQEVREVVAELERLVREQRLQTNDIRHRRMLDAALGLKPWPEDE